MYHWAVCRAVSCGLNPSLPTGFNYKPGFICNWAADIISYLSLLGISNKE
jgi:hypothetical protein